MGKHWYYSDEIILEITEMDKVLDELQQSSREDYKKAIEGNNYFTALFSCVKQIAEGGQGIVSSELFKYANDAADSSKKHGGNPKEQFSILENFAKYVVSKTDIQAKLAEAQMRKLHGEIGKAGKVR